MSLTELTPKNVNKVVDKSVFLSSKWICLTACSLQCFTLLQCVLHKVIVDGVTNLYAVLSSL